MKLPFWAGTALIVILGACSGEQPTSAPDPEPAVPTEPSELAPSSEPDTAAEPATEEPEPQASSAGGAPPAPAMQTVFDVTAEQAQKLLAFDQNVQVLDIRTPGEFESGSIPGALNIDFRGADFKERLGQLDRSTAYVVHCASGGRSGNSLSLFQELGFQKVYHMTDGFNGWSNLDTDSPE